MIKHDSEQVPHSYLNGYKVAVIIRVQGRLPGKAPAKPSPSG